MAKNKGSRDGGDSGVQTPRAKHGEITPAKIRMDFQRAFDYKKEWITEAHDDYLFMLGKQWDDNDVSELQKKGVLPLTINKIKPNVKLLSGIESQNRSDIMCYPEGAQSQLKAEIATALVKNTAKTSDLPYKVSDLFKAGITCGEGFLEPYIDYSDDMINGDMKFKKLPYNCVFPEPGFEEYDMSDAGYVIKVTMSLTRDQVLSLFPDKESYIDDIAIGSGVLATVGMETLRDQLGIGIQKKDNYGDSSGNVLPDPKQAEGFMLEEPRYDLVEYYFKKYVPHFYVIVFKYDEKTGKVGDAQIKEATDEKEAKTFIDAANLKQKREVAKLVKRHVPEIWRASVIGEAGKLIEEPARAPSYPRWKTYPIISFYADRYCVPVKTSETPLLVQGIVRDMKDLNREFNKRRTQELRILNSSANSGFMIEEGAIEETERGHWEKNASSPGVILVAKQGALSTGRIQKLLPTPISTGHAQLAAEGTQDMKESSGINHELLALESGEQSGRAIALRQKQGLVMVQHLFDNLSQTKRQLGRFVLSHLGEIYDIQEAIQVLGQSFLVENFSEPVMAPLVDPKTGQPARGPDGKPVMAPQMDPNTGQVAMQINQQAVMETFNSVLNDTGMGKYDVSIGETISSETLKFANYQILMDMMNQGFPIPPDVIVDESLLSQASKEKIKKALEQAQMQPQQERRPAPKRRKK